MDIPLKRAAEILPHGPGFRMVDDYELVEPGRRLVGRKWLDPALPFFADHFPGRPVVPGVMLIEAAAQAAGGIWHAAAGGGEPADYVVAQVEQFRLMKPVQPGRWLRIEVELLRNFGTLGQFEAVLSVEGAVVARGRILLSQPAKAD